MPKTYQGLLQTVSAHDDLARRVSRLQEVRGELSLLSQEEITDAAPGVIVDVSPGAGRLGVSVELKFDAGSVGVLLRVLDLLIAEATARLSYLAERIKEHRDELL